MTTTRPNPSPAGTSASSRRARAAALDRHRGRTPAAGRQAGRRRSVLAGGLVYYVGGRQLGETAFKILVAVGLSAALFIAANKLFDLAYPAWSAFCAACRRAVGFLGFLVLDGNHVLRDLSPRPWMWALIGGVAVGAAAFLPSARPAIGGPPLRLPVAVGGVRRRRRAARPWRSTNSTNPSSTGASSLLVRPLIGSRSPSACCCRRRATPTHLPGLRSLGAAIGCALGGWGVRRHRRGQHRPGDRRVRRRRSPCFGVRLGCQPLPTDTARRALEQRSRAWIFLIPALLLRHRWVDRPADPNGRTCRSTNATRWSSSGWTTTGGCSTTTSSSTVDVWAGGRSRTAGCSGSPRASSSWVWSAGRSPGARPASRSRRPAGRSVAAADRLVLRGLLRARPRCAGRCSTTSGGSSSSPCSRRRSGWPSPCSPTAPRARTSPSR